MLKVAMSSSSIDWSALTPRTSKAARPTQHDGPSLLLPQLLDSSSYASAGQVELEQAQKRDTRTRQRAPTRHACMHQL